MLIKKKNKNIQYLLDIFCCNLNKDQQCGIVGSFITIRAENHERIINCNWPKYK